MFSYVFRGVEKGCIGNKWVNLFEKLQYKIKTQRAHKENVSLTQYWTSLIKFLFFMKTKLSVSSVFTSNNLFSYFRIFTNELPISLLTKKHIFEDTFTISFQLYNYLKKFLNTEAAQKSWFPVNPLPIPPLLPSFIPFLPKEFLFSLKATNPLSCTRSNICISILAGIFWAGSSKSNFRVYH